MAARGIGPIAFLAAALLLSSCDPFAFDEIAERAPIVVLEAPDGYTLAGFGSVLASYSGTSAGASVSRLAVSAGPGSPVRGYSAWTGTDVAVESSLFTACASVFDCGTRAGAALAGFPTWHMGPSEESMCLLITTLATDDLPALLLVRCESKADDLQSFPGDASTTTEFGAVAAALPAGSPLGVALFSAPGANKVYRLPDGSDRAEINLGAGATDGVTRMGAVLAAAALADGSTLFAVAAPGEPGAVEAGNKRVIVAVGSAGPSGAGPVIERRACIDSTESGFAGAIALGDIDGDGIPELLIGTGADAATVDEIVRVYAGSDLPDAPSDDADADTACSEWGAAAVELRCPSVSSRTDIDCSQGGFGGALAIGDVNGDGYGDLVVGAPHAAVRGEANAGAVYVIPGASTGLDAARAAALTHSAPEGGAQLGRAVTTVRTRGRDEPVAGAPGSDEVAVFLCSGLDGDTPAVGDRCIPAI